MEDKKIKAGKPYEELTAEEKALIVDFKEEEHAELKTKYGKRIMKGEVLLEKMKGPAIFRAVKQEWKRW